MNNSILTSSKSLVILVLLLSSCLDAAEEFRGPRDQKSPKHEACLESGGLAIVANAIGELRAVKTYAARIDLWRSAFQASTDRKPRWSYDFCRSENGQFGVSLSFGMTELLKVRSNGTETLFDLPRQRTYVLSDKATQLADFVVVDRDGPLGLLVSSVLNPARDDAWSKFLSMVESAEIVMEMAPDAPKCHVVTCRFDTGDLVINTRQGKRMVIESASWTWSAKRRSTDDFGGGPQSPPLYLRFTKWAFDSDKHDVRFKCDPPPGSQPRGDLSKKFQEILDRPASDFHN